MGNVRGSPKADGCRIAHACADLVDHPAEAQVSQRVSSLEPKDDVAVRGFGPTEFKLQRRLEHADDLTIHIVDGGRCHHQPTHQPPIPAYRGLAPGHAPVLSAT